MTPSTPSDGRADLLGLLRAARAGRSSRGEPHPAAYLLQRRTKNAVPIETEAVTQVETLHRAAKKSYLLISTITVSCLRMALLYTGFGILGNSFLALADILALRGDLYDVSGGADDVPHLPRPS